MRKTGALLGGQLGQRYPAYQHSFPEGLSHVSLQWIPCLKSQLMSNLVLHMTAVGGAYGLETISTTQTVGLLFICLLTID